MVDASLAHTSASDDEQTWQPLGEHLDAVASLASRFASSFDSSEWGRLLGAWHDLGKHHPEFQAYLRGHRGSHPHSGAGAVHAKKRLSGPATALALLIAGHHAGLANPSANPAGSEGFPTPLVDRIKKAEAEEYPGTIAVPPRELLDAPIPALPLWIANAPRTEEGGRRVEFWLRFLFSCLIDADRLDTERFCHPTKSALREPTTATIEELSRLLEAHLSLKVAALAPEARDSPVNKTRREIAEACLRAAALPRGTFALTVPTGGGKTLAGMRFALRHAAIHGQRRVIVVIPFTSIIEQNVDVYAGILGHENVLEHHSNLDPKRARETKGEATTQKHELAAENWDMPVVVTTTVQFFESLFSNETSRCRKVHNIANSVVILDEVQALPPGFLYSITDALTELVERYRCTVVLSTATPPALRWREGRKWGLRNVRQIIENPSELAASLRRVAYEWPDLDAPAAEWPGLARDLARERQVLAVVHLRKDARELAQALQAADTEGPPVRHLSALMCPAHRRVVLKEVREDLAAGRPCRLVSTQLIEAGVDVDFPVVYRALGGLDSVVQAAGRCNREGKLARGRVVVFLAPTNPPRGVPTQGLQAASVLLRGDPSLQADDPEVQERFFRQLYGVAVRDQYRIQAERASLNFATVGNSFKLIEDGFSRPVVIPWSEGADALRRLKAVLNSGALPGREMYRALQPYTVNVQIGAFEQALVLGEMELICGDLYALSELHAHHYTEEYGLMIGDDTGTVDPTKLIF